MNPPFPNGPEFVYSVSRQRSFDGCKRRYWFNYYGYWNGWSGSVLEESDAQRIYVAKKRNKIPMWIGEVSHIWIGRLLEGKINADLVIGKAQDAVCAQWREAVANARRIERGQWVHPKDPVFLEHIRGEVDEEELEQGLHQIEDCINAVIADDYQLHFEEARAAGRYTFVETELGPSDFETQSITIQQGAERIKVFTKLDCVVEGPRNRYRIIDWKTGVPPSNEAASFQIRLYASWLQQQLEMLGRDWGEAEVEAYSVFLPSGDRHGGRLPKAVINSSLDEALAASRGLSKLHTQLVDQDGYLRQNQRHLCEPTPAEGRCSPCEFRDCCEDAWTE